MWKRAASYPPAAMPRVSHPGHRTVAWLSPDWPSRYAAAGAPVVWLTALGIWASVLAGDREEGLLGFAQDAGTGGVLLDAQGERTGRVRGEVKDVGVAAVQGGGWCRRAGCA